MKEYVLSVAFAVIICLGANLLTPTEKYRGIVKIVCGVFVVSVILSPIKALLTGDLVPEISYEDFNEDEFNAISKNSAENFKNNISENARDMLTLRISKELCDITGQKVTAYFTEDALYVEGVPAEEKSAVEKYVLEQYGVKTVFE